MRTRRQRLLAAGFAAALVVTLAACADSKRDDGGNNDNGSAAQNDDSGGAADQTGDGGGGDGQASDDAGGSEASGSGGGDAGGSGEEAPANGVKDATFTFGAAGAPEMFDPMYATDGETFRVARQMMEGLISFKPGTADIQPALAESWESSEDGLTWTFKIRQGVKFHDGTDLDAEAVCYNLDRMYSQTGAGQTQAVYWGDNFGGFKGQKDDDGNPVPSLYESCSADGDNAVVTINRYTSKFPAVLGLPAFSIQSPTALEKYKANDVKASGAAFVYPAYAKEHPTGTGPMKFSSYDRANGTIELVRNDDYWGTEPTIKRLIFKVIPDETARKQALQAGTIDGYDLPNPADWDSLKSDGFNVLIRPAFNILYLGINQAGNPALKDLKVRQAIAYAMNREAFVSSQLPEGAEVAKEFYPETVDGWTDEVQQYAYDPDKAKQLLAEAGQEDLTLKFWWPTEVSRPYMPNPKDVFTSFSADLEAVGINLEVTSKPWNGGYLDGVNAGEPDIYMLGWTGDYNTPDNFLGAFFSSSTNDFGTYATDWGKTLTEELHAADSEPDDAKRNQMYADLNVKLMSEYLPGIPISHSPPALVLAPYVEGIVASPLTDEDYAHAVITEK